jgi:hypothetical protein
MHGVRSILRIEGVTRISAGDSVGAQLLENIQIPNPSGIKAAQQSGQSVEVVRFWNGASACQQRRFEEFLGTLLQWKQVVRLVKDL